MILVLYRSQKCGRDETRDIFHILKYIPVYDCAKLITLAKVTLRSNENKYSLNWV